MSPLGMDDFSVAGDLGFGPSPKPGVIETSSRTCQQEANNRSRKKQVISPEWKLLARRKSSTDIGKDTQSTSFRFRRNSFCGDVSEERPSLKHSYADVFRKLKKRFSSRSFIESVPSKNPPCESSVSPCEDHEFKLAEAQKTIIALQGKLEIYKDLLHGKYQASEVLLDQLLESLKEHQQSKERYKEESRDTVKEINALQFQLHTTEGNLTDAQRTWLERFNDLIKENRELTSSLKTQTEIIKKLSAKNAVLKRERDELLALQDAKDKLAYRRSVSINEADSVTAMEMAILGACKCRGPRQEPCACAKAAAVKHRTIMTLQNYLDEFQQEKDDLGRLVQLYQNAFEEQLNRNRALTKKVLLQSCDYDLSQKPKILQGLLRLRGQKSSQADAVNSLVDLVCDRNDALLKQKLITKALTQRVAELETS